MLRHEQCEIRVLRLLRGILIAVAVYGDDAVGVFIDHGTLRIHTEGADVILVLLGTVDDLTLVELVGEVREDLGRQLDTDAEVHTVRVRRDLEVRTDLLHPLTATPTGGNHALLSLEGALAAVDPVALFRLLDGVDAAVEVEIDLIFQVIIEMLEHDIVDVGAEMTDGCVEEMETMLHAGLLKLRAGRRVELRALTAEFEIDLIDILHQLDGILLSDILVERAAEIVRDVVLSIREGTGTTETAHDRAAVTVDARFDLLSIDRALTTTELVAVLENRDLQIRTALDQLVGSENTARARTDN